MVTLSRFRFVQFLQNCARLNCRTHIMNTQNMASCEHRYGVEHRGALKRLCRRCAQQAENHRLSRNAHQQRRFQLVKCRQAVH